MTLPSPVLGIDVSKNRLDAYAGVLGKARAFPNTTVGVEALAAWAVELGAFAVLEATAPYDGPLMRALEASGVSYHRANPRKARQFARSAGFLAKTDQVDARMLAAYGAAVALRPAEPVSPQRLELQALAARRDELVAMRKAERTRLKADPADWLKASLGQLIEALSAQIAAVEARIEALLAHAAEDLAQTHRIVRTAPGVGPVTAVVLLAQMPELGRIDRRAISALAGLAPIACDSGSLRGKRRIWGGRKRVRDALYMAALGACRSGPFKADYQRLRANGKPAKLAIIAVARKLLVALNAAVRDQQPFRNPVPLT